MASSGSITRASLSLTDLAIVNTTYDLLLDDADLLTAGTVQWRRQTAESPFSPGRVLMQVVKDTPTMGLRFDVTGTSLSNVQTNVQTLLAAVWQTTYNLSITLDTGATYTWTCEPADVAVGFTYGHVLGLAAPVTLSVPRNPTPVAGPI